MKRTIFQRDGEVDQVSVEIFESPVLELATRVGRNMFRFLSKVEWS